MCVSAVVETERLKLAERLGLGRLEISESCKSSEHADVHLSRRIDRQGEAWIVRAGSAGRLFAERMTFNPYMVRSRDINGDMWTCSLLSSNHGLIVIKSFSEWVSVDLLLGQGMVSVHDVNCAYNRFTESRPGPSHFVRDQGRGSRLVLANFTPQAPLLVPVLFDARRTSDEAPDSANAAKTAQRDFVVISGAAPRGLDGTVDHAPVSLQLDAALEWLHIDEPDMPEDSEHASVIDFQQVLADTRPEAWTFSLYKSA